MSRGFKRDIAETKHAHEIKLLKDRRSFISLPKPSEHGDIHHLLAGVDVGPTRRLVFLRDAGMCRWCGQFVSEEFGDMCHRENKTGKRCDCLANLYWAHHGCHFQHDHPERL
jgi:hypothetical protein